MCKICVVGLGYVGLPLAVALSRSFEVVGFDINAERLRALRGGIDVTGEVTGSQLKGTKLQYVSSMSEARNADIFILTVPTPIDENKAPNLSPLINATESVAKVMEKDSLVIFESTVFPGATEEVCVPILEKHSQLKLNIDFSVGYSPERINPGDKVHTVEKIVKVISASNERAMTKMKNIYGSISSAGVYEAPSIMVAEASKVIENTQRDLNIAFINELSMIFDKLNLDTDDVLKAAATKWNFLNFKPGLVGGHCIGVDPYYLTQKATREGIYPELVLAGRRINENMSNFVAQKLVKFQLQNQRPVLGGNILIMGCTFKEDCPDFRNSKVFDLASELISFGANVHLVDPYSQHFDQDHKHKLLSLKDLSAETYDVAILAVAHAEFISMGPKRIRKLLKPSGTLYDLKYVFDQLDVDLRW